MSAKRKGDAVRAGIFLLVGVVVFTLAIFLLGQKSAVFSRTTTLFVSFEDISGLSVGTPVRLAGLEVGVVDALSLPADLTRKETQVRMVVQSKYMGRIRADSRAFIDSNGLLGDKIINISMGDPKAKPLSDGATLEPGASFNFESLSATMGSALKAAANVTHAVEGIVQDSRTTQLRDDLARAAASLATILGKVEDGPGLAHDLFYDQRYAEQVREILVDARGTVEHAKRAMARVDGVVAQVEQGQGTLHELVYGQSGKRALDELANAAQEIDQVVSAVREGNGVLHALLYDEGQGNFLTELNQLSVTLNRIVQDVDKGRGTVGALIRDPTVYEELKTALGNVERNVLFKALVRFTVQQENLRRADDAPRVRDESPTTK